MIVRRHVRPVVGACKTTGTKSRLWAYDVTALADLGGCSKATVRLDMAKGRLNPEDLWSVVAWSQERLQRKLARRSRLRKRLARAHARGSLPSASPPQVLQQAPAA